MENKDRDTDKELNDIAENACLQMGAGWKKELIMPIVYSLYTKMVLMVDSRYAEKSDVIRIAVDTVENVDGNPASLIPLSFLDMIFSEAKYFSNGRPRGRIVSPIEMIGDVDAFYNKGLDDGLILPGWYRLSEHYRVAKRELTTVTGIPGHGKSEFMDAVLIKLAENNNWRIAIYSPENYPFAVHIEKLLSKRLNKPFHFGRTDRMSPVEVSDGVNWLNEHFVFLNPDEDHINLESVLSLTLKAGEEKPIDGLIIDPWNELEHNMPQGQNETQYVGRALSKCRRFARQNNIALWIVAHPTKLQKKKDSDIYSPPDPYSISGSAHWRNKSDNCLCVYRNKTNDVEVYIQKIKYKIRGRLGCVNFTYDVVTGNYFEKGTKLNELPK